MSSAPCDLCRIARAPARPDPDPVPPVVPPASGAGSTHVVLARSRSTTIVPGPFRDRWPGALMVVSNRHVEEQTDLRPGLARAAHLDVLDAERALRLATGCARVNVVKFGNVAPHLHWHVIPRYVEEAHRRLTPWEIVQAHPGEVYPGGAAPFTSQGLRLDSAVLYARLSSLLAESRHDRHLGTFGAALFLRPVEPATREACVSWPLERVLAEAKANPSRWESFLMQRNYLDRSWDHFGGNGEVREFPETTMRREVGEELGWVVGEALEVTRHWEAGLLRGILFLARPRWEGDPYAPLADDPPRHPCDEVAQARWVNMEALARGKPGVRLAPGVRERHAAVAEGRPDFISDDC